MSEWNDLVMEAHRGGLPMKDAMREASRAYRSANVHVYRNPSDPHEQRRHHRRKRVGELLSRGVPFHEAQRLIDREFGRYQHGQRQIERTIVHPFSRSRRNPTGGGEPNWLLIGAAAFGAWWFFLRKPAAGAPPPTGGGLIGIVNQPPKPCPPGIPTTVPRDPNTGMANGLWCNPNTGQVVGF